MKALFLCLVPVALSAFGERQETPSTSPMAEPRFPISEFRIRYTYFVDSYAQNDACHNIEMKFLLAILVAASLLAAAELKLGKPFSMKKPVSVATLLARPDDYIGKTVQVKGKITEVCQMMGCWMDLVNDSGQKIRIKVNDGEIVFPKDASGKVAVAEGRFTKIVLTRDQAIAGAEDEAREAGRKFDPASAKDGMTLYQIQGTGAVITLE